MHFEMRTSLYVGSATGPWHAFLCANLVNAVTGTTLELCDEPYNSAGTPIQTGLRCNGGNFATWWQRPGETNSIMNTYGTTTSRSGVNIPVHWTMTRSQFINLINAVASQCGIPADTAMDNWKLKYSQNGMESYGPAGYGAGVSFQISDETMITWY
jgi:hypothetical protein